MMGLVLIVDAMGGIHPVGAPRESSHVDIILLWVVGVLLVVGTMESWWSV